jgi:hypothetical protein
MIKKPGRGKKVLLVPAVSLSQFPSDLNFSSRVIHEAYTCPSLPHPPHTTLMPPREKNAEPQRESVPEPEPYPSRPRTRQKNATQRPGVEAEKRLRVRRDPEVVQEEKEARKRKKEEKERAQREEATNNEAAAHFVKENRAQQKVAMAEEEASMPRRRSQGMRYFYLSASVAI